MQKCYRRVSRTVQKSDDAGQRQLVTETTWVQRIPTAGTGVLEDPSAIPPKATRPWVFRCRSWRDQDRTGRDWTTQPEVDSPHTRSLFLHIYCGIFERPKLETDSSATHVCSCCSMGLCKEWNLQFCRLHLRCFGIFDKYLKRKIGADTLIMISQWHVEGRSRGKCWRETDTRLIQEFAEDLGKSAGPRHEDGTMVLETARSPGGVQCSLDSGWGNRTENTKRSLASDQSRRKLTLRHG